LIKVSGLIVSRDHPDALRHVRPTRDIVLNMERVCDHVNQFLGLSEIVTSGYRDEVLNNLVGGWPNSAHLEGLAVDIDTPKIASIVARIKEKELDFDLIILYSWGIHYGLSNEKSRREIKDWRPRYVD